MKKTTKTDKNNATASDAAPAEQTDNQGGAVAGDNVGDGSNGGNGGDNPAAPAPDAPALTELEAAVQRAQESHDNYLRAMAELENTRRRYQKQLEDVRKYALTDFATAVAEVRDCLDTAMQSNNTQEQFRDGVALTLRKLISTMEERHIYPIVPDVGVAFDPELHMAIGVMPKTAALALNTIGQVVQIGYMLNGRVLRSAKVLVVQEAEQQPSSETAKNNKE